MKILAFGNYSRVGKDTVANYTLDYLKGTGLKAEKRSFAYKLKQITAELYGWAGLREPAFYETKEGEKLRDVPLAFGKTPVEVWVAVGNLLRDGVYPATWIDCVVKSTEGLDVCIIPDCRYANEAEAIKAAGGKLVKVVRPGFGPRKTVADRALLGYTDWDYVIGSSGTMLELEMWGNRFAAALAGQREWPVQTEAEKAEALKVEVIEPWLEDPARITRALAHGWFVDDGEGRKFLMPPDGHRASLWCAEWAKIPYQGHDVFVPDFLERVLAEDNYRPTLLTANVGDAV